MRISGLTACLFVVMPCLAAAEPAGDSAVPLDMAYFLNRLVDIDALPRFDAAEETRQISTWDRAGANADSNHYLDEETGVYRQPGKPEAGTVTVARIEGPGCITRIFCAIPGGFIRFYLDGSPEPVIAMATSNLFTGVNAPFLAPLAYCRDMPGGDGLGYYSYVPIPFARSCRVTVTLQPDLVMRDYMPFGGYYAVSYSKYPAGTAVITYTGQLADAEQTLLDQAVAVWRRWQSGQDPRGEPGAETKIATGASDVAPGATLEMAGMPGAGWITALRVKLAPADPRMLRRLRLLAWWDGDDTAAVDAPLGDFFGYGLWYGGGQFTTLLIGNTRAGYYSYFPMPFANGARVAVRNDGREAVPLEWEIAWHKRDALPDDVLRFHARWRQERPPLNRPPDNINTNACNNITVADIHGEGRYVGCNLHMLNRVNGWWGEGDAMFFLDDEPWPPRFHGTGNEDYFNSAWCVFGNAPLNYHAACQAPFRGYGRNPWVVGQLHLLDPIVFHSRARITFEHWSGDGMRYILDPKEVMTLYGATAYWYQRGTHAPAPPAGDDLIGAPMPDLAGIAEILRGSSDPARRADAVRAMVFFGYTDSVLLAPLRADPDPQIRALAWELCDLHKAPVPADEVIRAMADGTIAEKYAAARIAAEAPPADRAVFADPLDALLGTLAGVRTPDLSTGSTLPEEKLKAVVVKALQQWEKEAGAQQ